MSELKYKVGDKVLIKSMDWYNENKNIHGDIWFDNVVFTGGQSLYCGCELTIRLVTDDRYYVIENDYYWTDGMIECKVEEEIKPKFKVGDKITNGEITFTILRLSSDRYGTEDTFGECGSVCFNSQDDWKIVEEETKSQYEDKLKLDSTKTVREYWSEYARIFIEIYDNEPNECVLTHLYTLEGHRQKGYGKQALIEAESIAKELDCHTAYLKVETNSWMHEWYLRMGYKWYKTVDKEYVWLAKNLTSIEKKEYPKTIEECCKILGLEFNPFYTGVKRQINYKDGLLHNLKCLLIYRDAYWKIAGEEMGFDKPWEPIFDFDNNYFVITNLRGEIIKFFGYTPHDILVFPTEEMREAFYKNFKKEIEICKEFL